SFLKFLDSKVGKGQYTVFLSADHGGMQVPEFMKENRLPGERVFISTLTKELNKELKEKYNSDSLIVSDDNYQFTFNPDKVNETGISKTEIQAWLIKRLEKETGISRVFAIDQLNQVPLPALVRDMLNNGFYPQRGGDVQIILKPGYIEGYSKTGTTHGLWNPYDAHIPLLWYGWGIKHGKSNQQVKMTDIAPTVAALLHIQVPSGSIGKPIEQVIK
ncbi:MAG TPA: alkaline phosphatase family protein, partial [Chitinophagaceae bacterium]|nr:alkaline phosphatase family protein [Chitinophagaceae bacterium]